MSKTRGRLNGVEIRVEPRRMGDIGFASVSDRLLYGDNHARWEAEILGRAREIAAQIKRHVDNVGAVYVVEDRPDVCEFCGATWTEDSTDYNGGCCDADQTAQEATA